MAVEGWAAILSPQNGFTASSRCVSLLIASAHSSVCRSLYYRDFCLLFSPFASSPLPLAPFSLIPPITIHIHVNITAVMSISGCMHALLWETEAFLQIREMTVNLYWWYYTDAFPNCILSDLGGTHCFPQAGDRGFIVTRFLPVSFNPEVINACIFPKMGSTVASQISFQIIILPLKLLTIMFKTLTFILIFTFVIDVNEKVSE